MRFQIPLLPTLLWATATTALIIDIGHYYTSTTNALHTLVLETVSASDLGGGGTIKFPSGARSANLNISPVSLSGTTEFSGFNSATCSFTRDADCDLNTKIVDLWTGSGLTGFGGKVAKCAVCFVS